MSSLPVPPRGSILERARAREIYCTWCMTNDKDLVMRHIEGSKKLYGRDGAERILAYTTFLTKAFEMEEPDE